MDTILFIAGGHAVTVAEAAAAFFGLLILALIVMVMRQSKERALEAQAQLERQSRTDEQVQRLLSVQSAVIGRLQGMGEALSTTRFELQKGLSERLDAVSKHVGDNLTTGAQATNEQLKALEARLAVIDAAQQNIGSLSEQVTSLKNILANKPARGAFGQGQMEAIIKDALPSSGYSFQHTLSTRSRPDCVIWLPGDKRGLVVDAKFPLEAFELLRRAETPEDEKFASQRLRQDMIAHILAVKQYLIPEETQEVALLFVPSEALHAELHERFGEIVQRAQNASVLIVSPSLLMLSIQVVQGLMRDAAMRDKAHFIQKEVRMLLDDVGRLVDRTQNLKRHMAQTDKDLREIETSAEKIGSRGQRIDRMDFDGPTPEGQTLPARAQGELLPNPLLTNEAAE